MSAEDRPEPGRGDWVTLADGVRVSRGWMTRHTPRLLAAWCDTTSAAERRAVGVRILQVASTLESEPADDDQQPAERTWEALARRIDPRLVSGPDWPPLAAALDRAAADRYDVASRLPALARAAPLPDRHPARELHWRLLDACPAAVPRRHGSDHHLWAHAGGDPQPDRPSTGPRRFPSTPDRRRSVDPIHRTDDEGDPA